MPPLFVVSDVHGFRDDLVEGLAEFGLVTGDGRWSGADAQLWILGDLMDRGPDGIGVVNFVMSLQSQAPDQVHPLLGNHEALAVGTKRFPDSSFAQSWLTNGGQARDQDSLTDEHLTWLSGLPPLARVEDFLFMHSDTTAYLTWGSTVHEVNESVAAKLASDDVDAHWEVWAQLTSRYHFAVRNGSSVATRMLDGFGGTQIVHGHSIIGTLTNQPSDQITGPVVYADGQVLAIDGGRYDGGPLLVIRLR